MDIKIVKCRGNEWYKNCIGRRFTVHSESRKGGRGKYIVRLEKYDRYLMNGHMYGWVDKEHCILLKPIELEFVPIDFGAYLKEVEVKEGIEDAY